MKLRTALEIAIVAAGSVTGVGAVLVVRGADALGYALAAAGFVAGVALRLWERWVWRREVNEAREHVRRIRMEEDT